LLHLLMVGCRGPEFKIHGLVRVDVLIYILPEYNAVLLIIVRFNFL